MTEAQLLSKWHYNRRKRREGREASDELMAHLADEIVARGLEHKVTRRRRGRRRRSS